MPHSSGRTTRFVSRVVRRVSQAAIHFAYGLVMGSGILSRLLSAGFKRSVIPTPSSPRGRNRLPPPSAGWLRSASAEQIPHPFPFDKLRVRVRDDTWWCTRICDCTTQDALLHIFPRQPACDVADNLIGHGAGNACMFPRGYAAGRRGADHRDLVPSITAGNDSDIPPPAVHSPFPDDWPIPIAPHPPP